MSQDIPGGETPYIDRGEPLPRSYGENTIVALVCDPEHVYVYWDIDTEVRVAALPLVLRMHFLSEGRVIDHEVGPGTDNWWFSTRWSRVRMILPPVRMFFLEVVSGFNFRIPVGQNITEFFYNLFYL